MKSLAGAAAQAGPPEAEEARAPGSRPTSARTPNRGRRTGEPEERRESIGRRSRNRAAGSGGPGGPFVRAEDQPLVPATRAARSGRDGSGRGGSAPPGSPSTRHRCVAPAPRCRRPRPSCARPVLARRDQALEVGYSSGWSSVCTARRRTPRGIGRPFGTAQEASAPRPRAADRSAAPARRGAEHDEAGGAARPRACCCRRRGGLRGGAEVAALPVLAQVLSIGSHVCQYPSLCPTPRPRGPSLV